MLGLVISRFGVKQVGVFLNITNFFFIQFTVTGMMLTFGNTFFVCGKLQTTQFCFFFVVLFSFGSLVVLVFLC